MCGICGIVNFNATEPVNHHLVERMTSAQMHRGPDDKGYFVENNVGLGHRRLSIIDLSGGKQPIFNEDGSVVVVFNGEIYNFADLTADLISRGHQFRTRSDTETIVHAYEEYGVECMKDFRGMFAFAIWDRRQKRLLLVRDRLGIKPVYYYAGKDFFVFASEIKSLLQHPGVPREVDHQAVDLYLALRYVPGPRTMFKNIFKLQPGHWMTVDKTGIKSEKYWDIDYGKQASGSDSPEEYVEEFARLFEESVRLRLISEVPLGVFLSGGLDSSAMLAMMSKITGGERVKTFSVGYETRGPAEAEAKDANELSYARQAAAHFGAEHHEFCLGARDFGNAIPTMLAHLDEPMADPTCIPLYFISKLARNHITVVLSGEGADETMAGYALYRRILFLEKIRNFAGPLSGVFPALAGLPFDDRTRAYLRRAGTKVEDHYRGVVKGLSLERRLALAGPERLTESERHLNEIFAPYFRHTESASALNRMLYADTKIWLPENLLLKGDKMTMATSVELRVPFLDHKLVEYLATLPDSLKVRGNQGKWILRQVMGNVLPPSILHRTKRGFPIPAVSWLRYELRDFVRDTLLGRKAACREFFDPQAIEEIVTLQEKGKTSGFQEVWSLLVFESWHKQFIESIAPAEDSGECVVEVDAHAGRGA
ncbi:MAG TPA: asparagine synthase (glutamine-hydrolyzing) [Terriglobia bacterium]|nr:asparagine synthase (glutamine-hydrolyzing) [Terriglobia bacterium]